MLCLVSHPSIATQNVSPQMGYVGYSLGGHIIKSGTIRAVFERIKSEKKLRNADKAAKQVVSFVAPCLFAATDTNGSLDPRKHRR